MSRYRNTNLGSDVAEGDVGQQRAGDLLVEVLQLLRRVTGLVDAAREAVVLQRQPLQEAPVAARAEGEAEDGRLRKNKGVSAESQDREIRVSYAAR